MMLGGFLGFFGDFLLFVCLFVGVFVVWGRFGWFVCLFVAFFPSLIPLSTSYPLAAVKHWLLCKLGTQEPSFL